jgi:hypothetical protein
MTDSTVFTLTSSKLAEWQHELTAIDQEINAKQRRRQFLAERLHAAAVLMGGRADGLAGTGESKAPLQAETLFEAAKPAGAEHKAMIDAVEKMANESPRPITKGDVRKRLLEMGYPEGSLGNYFYTVVARLKGKNRIAVMPNGSIWRSPS